MVGLAGGLITSGLLYVAQKTFLASAPTEDEMVTLKKELIKELKQYPIDGPKEADYTFTKDFMITLFKLMYTYQVIAKEIVKESGLWQRLEYLRDNNDVKYQESIESRTEGLQAVSLEIKEIVFDYFNIISKEYEMSYEKYKQDEEYKKALNDIKE